MTSAFNNKWLARLGLGFSVLLASQVQADTLTPWQLVSPDQYPETLADIQLPGQLGTQQAIVIDAATLVRMQVDDTLVVAIAPNQDWDYLLQDAQRFVNGDWGWRAGFSDADQQFSLSLTFNSSVVLATVYSPSGKYYLRAMPVEGSGDYVGWLYSLADDLTLLPFDEGAVVEGRSLSGEVTVDYAEINSNEVTVEQTFSDNLVTAGNEVDISITLTNVSDSTLSDIPVTILFTPDVTDLVSSSSGCVTGSTGLQNSFDCSTVTLAAGVSTTINYRVRIREEAYPQIDNAVFVGELFGEHVRDDEFITIYKDTLSDSDGDGISDFNEAIANTDPNNALSRISSDFISEVDLLFLYTQRFVDDITLAAPETEINQLIQVTNGYFSNSSVNVEFRPVYYGLVDYQVNNNLGATLDAIRDGSDPAFQNVDNLRANIGADVVVIIDGIVDSGNSCGLGTTPGVGFEGQLFHALISNPDVYVGLYQAGFPQGGGSGCDEQTLAHELGHNFGLNHSHRSPNSGATLPWAFGHGVDGSFTTIMAYSSNFPGSESLPRFSDPGSNDCKGMPCGVSRDDSDNGADAVHALNHTRFQIADRRTSRLIDTATVSGDGSNLIMFGGATRNGNTDSLVSSYVPQDSIDVRATLAIPSEHQGRIGETYVVIVVDGLGLFYRDHLGGYQSWDGEFGTLAGNIQPRALNATEELIAFSDFVPADFGVTSASLTVFFAYAVNDTDVFVYSATGVPFTIQP